MLSDENLYPVNGGIHLSVSSREDVCPRNSSHHLDDQPPGQHIDGALDKTMREPIYCWNTITNL